MSVSKPVNLINFPSTWGSSPSVLLTTRGVPHDRTATWLRERTGGSGAPAWIGRNGGCDAPRHEKAVRACSWRGAVFTPVGKERGAPARCGGKSQHGCSWAACSSPAPGEDRVSDLEAAMGCIRTTGCSRRSTGHSRESTVRCPASSIRASQLILSVRRTRAETPRYPPITLVGTRGVG